MGFSAPSRPQSPPTSRSSLIVTFLKFLAICFVSILVLVAVLGSGNRHFNKHQVYSSYRRLEEGALRAISYDAGFYVGSGNPSLKNVRACPDGMEDYVPCYHVASLKARSAGVKDLGRDCYLLKFQRQCIVRPPKGYRLPLKWPACRDNVWSRNVHISEEHSKRALMEESVIKFPSEDSTVENYVSGLEAMVSLDTDKSFGEMGVRLVLDVECGLAGLSSFLLSKNLLTMSISAYKVHGAAVQLAQERGLPAMIGSFSSNQLPYPFAAYDMIHCGNCEVQWHQKDGLFLFEANRLLRPGGYFVWSPSFNQSSDTILKLMGKLTSNVCWSQVAHNNRTIIWQKTTKQRCYSSRRSTVCTKEFNSYAPWSQPAKACITDAPKSRWRTVQQQHLWPNRLMLTARRLSRYGMASKDFNEDVQSWLAKLTNYWSLFTPVIFSDHPKRPGNEDPPAPRNVVRNVMDMNAQYGGFNAALLSAGKPVWVMNVVPTTSDENTLSVIYDRGLLGVNHDWCEAFPAYPRAYDLLYATSLLSQEFKRPPPCGLPKLLLEMDRLLRPEGWILLQDETHVVEIARSLLLQIRWEARIVKLPGQSYQRLLVGQKNWRK